MIDLLLEPFRFPFMVNAFIISGLIAVPAALLSCFLVLKGWALMGDAISHAIFPGVVLAYIIGWPLGVGAFAAGMFCALATGYLHENSRIKQDTVMGVVFAGMFGLGLVIYVKVETNLHLNHILFGNMLGIGWPDIVETALIAAGVSLLLLLKWRDLVLQAFDPTQAQAVGLRVGWLHYGLLAIISLTIVGALKAVGIILSIAILIAPGAIAFLLARRFSMMLILSVVVAVSSAFAGVYLSFFINSDPAATIVLVLTVLFILAFLHVIRRSKRMATGTALSAGDGG